VGGGGRLNWRVPTGEEIRDLVNAPATGAYGNYTGTAANPNTWSGDNKDTPAIEQGIGLTINPVNPATSSNLILPNSGQRMVSSPFRWHNQVGEYWTSAPVSNNAYVFEFSSPTGAVHPGPAKLYSCSLRCVRSID
jgi:hypothetical protein